MDIRPYKGYTKLFWAMLGHLGPSWAMLGYIGIYWGTPLRGTS